MTPPRIEMRDRLRKIASGTVYTADIAEPTSVRKLVNELIEQVGLALWWDDVRRQVRFQAIRRIQASADRLTPNNVDEGSLTITEQWPVLAARSRLARMPGSITMMM